MRSEICICLHVLSLDPVQLSLATFLLVFALKLSEITQPIRIVSTAGDVSQRVRGAGHHARQGPLRDTHQGAPGGGAPGTPPNGPVYRGFALASESSADPAEVSSVGDS